MTRFDASDAHRAREAVALDRPPVCVTDGGRETAANEGVRASRAPVLATRRRRSLTKKDREAFLEALAAGWSVRHAAERTGRRFQSFYEERERDATFADAWGEAFEQGTQRLEDEATRRGLEGYDEETFDGEDKLIRRVRRYDSALLQQQLKRRRPEAYRDNAAVELKTPAVFVLESSFGPPHDIEAEAVESPPELPRGDDE